MNGDWSAEIQQVIFQPGDILFRENEASYHFFIVQEGKVEVFKHGKGGAEISLAVIHAGSSVGEFAMIDRLPRSATARALTEVQATQISDVAYQRLIQDLPEWAVSVMRGLVDRLRQTNEIVRRSGIVAEEVEQEIRAVENELDAGTITDTSPFLLAEDDDTEEFS